MLDGLIAKLRGFLPDAELLSGDALGEAFVGVLAARLTPWVASLIVETRYQLITALRPEPPTTYAAELRAIAPNLTDAHIEKFWSATFRAICAEQPKKPRLLASVSPAALAEANGRDITMPL